MALIVDEPPSPLPLGTWIRLPPRCSSGSVTKSQSWSVLKSCVNAAGMEVSRRNRAAPASSSKVRHVGSALSRLASTQPAEPAPTTMKSVELGYIPAVCMHRDDTQVNAPAYRVHGPP